MADTLLTDALLGFLRRSLSSSDVRFAEPPVALTGGFDTTILAFRLANAPDAYSAPSVLRLMPAPTDGPRVARENAAHTALAAAGFAAPRILLHSFDDRDLGAPFLIMDRLAGQNLWENAFGPQGKRSRIFNFTRVLAKTHADLHGLDPQTFVEALAAAGLNPEDFTLAGEVRRLQERIERAALRALGAGAAWLCANVPPAPATAAICHGDFHPLNIVMDGDGLSGVVDWSQAIVAEPAYDVACTTVLLRFGPADATGMVRMIFERVRSLPIRRYLSFYASHRQLDKTHFAYYECVRTLSALTYASEASARAANPWRDPRTTTALARYFRDRSGVDVDG
jgi:aminoglycoside phosphotransferase (APT) family kinase protein